MLALRFLRWMAKAMLKKNLKLTDSKILIWGVLLSGVIFVTELILPLGAISGVLFVLVVILSLLSTKRKQTIYFAIATSLLIGLDIILSLPQGETWEVVADRLFAILTVWFTAGIILQYKQTQKVKSDLAAIVDSSEDAIIGITLEGTIVSWNKGAENLLGYTSEEMVGQPANRFIPEDRIDKELQFPDKVSKGKKIQQYETVRKHKDGYLIHISLTLSPIKDSFGNIIGISSIARNITERKKLHEKIILEKKKLEEVLNIEEHLNTIFDINKLVDFVVDKTTKVLEAEKCSVMFVDYNTRDLCVKGYKGIDDRIILESKLKIGDPVAGLIVQEGKPILVTDIENDKRFLRSNRPSYQSKSFISSPIKLGNNIMGVISVADKISKDGNVFSEVDLKILCMIVRQVAVAMENTKLYRELKYLTITDPLTQIYNYRHFSKSLDHEIVRLKRYPRPLCLLMIDVDDFKSYNDTFGHLDGDALLMEISKTLNQNIREVDIACRYAGDEFVVILPETDFSEAMIVAEKIKKGTETLSLKRKVTISVGIAKCAKNMSRYDLIQRADMALLEAKKQGKNKVHSLG